MTPDSFWTPVVLSLEVAAISTAMCVVMGGAVAYAMSRRSFPGYALLDGVFNLPLVLPPLVTGYFLLIVFGASGPLGRLLESVGIRFPFTLGAAVLAAFVVSFPLFYRAAKLAFENVDRELEGVAATLGAAPWDRFRTITLPLASGGIATGALLAFARSLGEFGATIVFAANIPGRTQTIPLAIYNALNIPGGESQAIPLVVVATALSFAAMLASLRWSRRNGGEA